ncbi:MAG: hypothetical protein AAGJ82_08345 [Bacteroidota bacterium]
MELPSIAFTTIVENGTIKLPNGYDNLDKQQVKVIVSVAQNNQDAHAQSKRLLNIFEQMERVAMFSDIQDPLGWQKQLRDEWE